MFSRTTKLNSALLVILLSGVASFAQVPGAGGPAGMSAAITKLFGNIKTFTAKAEVQVLDNSQKEIVFVPMEFALLDKTVRVEMDLTKMKNQQMPPGVADSLKQMGMAHVVSIISPSKKSAFVIYPDQKSVLTMALPEVDSNKEPKIEKKPLGKETIDGHSCVKNQVLITDEKGEKIDATTWNATDLKDFPVQIQTKESENTSLVKFKQVQFAAPDPAQFEPPTGYTQYSSQQDLMQGIMKKMMQDKSAEKK